MLESEEAPTLAERFAVNLRRLRDETRMNQEDLAFRAGIHRTQISYIESGARMPRLDTLLKLAGALEVSVADLVSGISRAPSEQWMGRFVVAPQEAADATEKE